MDKFTEFYTKLMQDETARNKAVQILAGKEFIDANDEQLLEIGEIAKGFGYEITLEEAKTCLQAEDKALEDEELEAVAGGKGVKVYLKSDDMEQNTHVDWTRAC